MSKFELIPGFLKITANYLVELSDLIQKPRNEKSEIIPLDAGGIGININPEPIVLAIKESEIIKPKEVINEQEPAPLEPAPLEPAPLEPGTVLTLKPSGTTPREPNVFNPFGIKPMPAPPVLDSMPLSEKEDYPPHSKLKLDASGNVWDARIHSSMKSKDKYGNWKYLRKASPLMINKVEKENRLMPPLPREMSMPLEPPVIPEDFSSLMTIVTGGITSDKIKHADIKKILDTFSLPSLAVVASRPDLIPTISMMVKGVIDVASR